MTILGLDLSTSAGWAIVTNGSLVTYGLKVVHDENTYMFVPDYAQIDRSIAIAKHVSDLLKNNEIDYIYIEQTNAGSFRTSQRQLEFIHYAVLQEIRLLGHANKVRYVDTSAWRKKLDIRLDKTQREHNKMVKAKKAKGKITWKHLAVNWVNAKFGMNLLLKDDDIADAIAVAFYGNLNVGGKAMAHKDLAGIF